jgi:type I restriction enzyme S subunit
MAILRAHREKIDPRFLLYAYIGPDFQEVIKQRTVHGATVDRIPLTEMATWPIAVPDLRNQRAIGELLGVLDDKIEIDEAISSTARQLMNAKFREHIANNLQEVRVGDLCEIFDGPHATPAKTDSGPWFLSIGSLVDGRLKLSESAHLAEVDYKRWTRRVTPQFGDVLFSYETRLGEAALMPKGVRACLGRRMALLRPRTASVDGRILLHAFLAHQFQDTIRRRSVHGATVDRIPLTELPDWPIAVPASGMDALSASLCALDDLAASNDRANETLAELRDALLPKLMSGEIRVRDAEKVVEDVT